MAFGHDGEKPILLYDNMCFFDFSFFCVRFLQVFYRFMIVGLLFGPKQIHVDQLFDLVFSLCFW